MQKFQHLLSHVGGLVLKTGFDVFHEVLEGEAVHETLEGSLGGFDDDWFAVSEFGEDGCLDVLGDECEVLLESFGEVLRDEEAALGQVDVVIQQEALDQGDKLGVLSGHDGCNLRLLDELIQHCLLVLPLLDFQCFIHPSGSVHAQHIKRFSVLLSLCVHVVEHLLALRQSLPLESSLDLHGYFHVLLAEFGEFILDFHVYFELLEGVVPHPPVDFLVELDGLRFGHRFGRRGQQFEVFGELLQELQAFDTVVVEEGSDEEDADGDDLSSQEGYLRILVEEFLVEFVEQQLLVAVVHVPEEDLFAAVFDVFLVGSHTLADDGLDHCLRLHLQLPSAREVQQRQLQPPLLHASVVEGDELQGLLLEGLVGCGVFARQSQQFVQGFLLDLPQFGGHSFGEGDGFRGPMIGECVGGVGWVGRGLLSAYSGISNLVLLPMGLSSKAGLQAGKASFQSFILQFKLQLIKSVTSAQVQIIYMSFPKARTYSAQRILHTQEPKRKRVERVQTEVTKSAHQDGSRPRPVSREESSRRLKLDKGRYQQPQRMLEQNLNLKNFINDLQEQLSLQRGRLEASKKKTFKFVKQLNREFSKEVYYSGKNPNSYMISGVKQQYENVKQMYEEKCREVEQVYKCVEYTAIEELGTYIEALLYDNRLLKERLDTYLFIKQNSAQLNHHYKQSEEHPHRDSEVDKLYTEYSDKQNEEESQLTIAAEIQFLTTRLAEYKNSLAKAERLVDKFSSKSKSLEKNLTEANRKIAFLQKIIIEKDNNEHHFKRKTKNLEQTRNQMEFELKKVKEELLNTHQRYEQKIVSIKETESKKYEIENDIFRRAIEEKNDSIAKLEKEIRFLSTLLSYWKPLDEINHQFMADISKSKQEIQMSDKAQEEKASQSLKIKVSEPNRKSSMHSDQMLMGFQANQPYSNEHDKSFKSNRDEGMLNPKNTAMRSQSLQNVSSSIVMAEKRLPQNCSTKYNEHAKKMRKVDINEIRRYGELLRYRLIGFKISIEEVKRMFDYVGGDQSEESSVFHREYISMREIKEKMALPPFALSPSEAELVGRYIVENSSNQYIYCDENNEINRNIAKSIIKALIGEYQLANQHQIEQQWQHLKKIYIANLQIALKSIAPSGLIAESKFIDLINGLGIELSDGLKDWIIGSMVIGSASLQELKYAIVIHD